MAQDYPENLQLLAIELVWQYLDKSSVGSHMAAVRKNSIASVRKLSETVICSWDSLGVVEKRVEEVRAEKQGGQQRLSRALI